jgi:hypothetical protein
MVYLQVLNMPLNLRGTLDHILPIGVAGGQFLKACGITKLLDPICADLAAYSDGVVLAINPPCLVRAQVVLLVADAPAAAAAIGRKVSVLLPVGFHCQGFVGYLVIVPEIGLAGAGVFLSRMS